MARIVICVTILALACVNAQMNFPNPGAIMGGIWNNPMFPKMNIPMPNPNDFINMKPRPGQQMYSSSVTQTSENGKVVTTMESNDNGKVKRIIVTN